mmetsp:Transcript_8684/g.23415  ORF Transcript_8684/g.23415 Transcript_8684/m.23415 type:complete len:141 (+) Transcript_8684:3084-3506(+)
MEDWRTQFLKPRSLRGFNGDIVAWCSEWGVDERIAMQRKKEAQEYIQEKERKRAIAHPQYARAYKKLETRAERERRKKLETLLKEEYDGTREKRREEKERSKLKTAHSARENRKKLLRGSSVPNSARSGSRERLPLINSK